MSEFNFNADFNNVQSDDYSPMPVGEYQVSCVKAEKLMTKAGTGEYIKCEFDVMGDAQGNYKGRKLWMNFNINNPNPKAVEISIQQLNTYMMACNLKGVNDTSQLTGYAVIAKVKIKRDEQYGDSNEITTFKPISGATPPNNTHHPEVVNQAPPAPPVAPQAQPNGAVTPPWQTQ